MSSSANGRIQHLNLGAATPAQPAAGPGDRGGHPDTVFPLPTISSPWLKKLIFLGTGTSGQVPAIHCITNEDPKAPISCAACADSVKFGEFSRNRRKCTGAIVVGSSAKGSGQESPDNQTTILIDCGPTFYSSAIKVFPQHGLRKIDAVLLTHAHADAMLGLDHLRAWTLGGVVQSHVSVYLTQETMDVVATTFPYLVDKKKATGGGGVGALHWHIIDSRKSFWVGRGPKAVQIIPLSVMHGFAGGKKTPFEFTGFRIKEISYVSDCNEIPQRTMDLMEGSKVLVIDALKWRPHASHFSVGQGVDCALSLKGGLELALMTDLCHQLEHWDLSSQLFELENGLRAAAAGSTGQLQPQWWSQFWNVKESEDEGRLRLRKDPPSSGTAALEGRVPALRVAYDEQTLTFV